jgi:hypothetical protein
MSKVMTPVELTIAIQSLLSLIVLVIVVFGLWPAQRMDLFRQQMFAIRDELFDFAAEGNVKFDEPAYLLLRQLMNGFIRYAHNLTPYRTLMAFLRWKVTPNQLVETWSPAWDAAMKNISDQNIRAKLQEFHSRATLLVVGQLVLSPGLLTFVLLPFAVLVILYSQWTTLRNIYNDVRSRIPMSFLEEEAVRN